MNYDEIKKHIVNLSRYKVNVFHWHLTENQGWRLESKRFPQLNAPSSYTRHPGKYYTIEQAKELVAFAKQHNIIVIPEIDMPGHSEAFTRAFGYTMQTPQGLETLKELMNEICDVFKDSEWMHIGTDEVKITMPNFVPDMVRTHPQQREKGYFMESRIQIYFRRYRYDHDVEQPWPATPRETGNRLTFSLYQPF
jgi:N-acetyl-beta-hexosaminidase